MTFEECEKGLGRDKKFVVESRFAVCNGASSTKGNIPQSWPSGVRYTRGWNVPGTKTFAELKALRTFTQTANAKPGQGSSGSTDLCTGRQAVLAGPSVGCREPGANFSQGSTRECDEYLFATTYEGAAEHDFDEDARLGHVFEGTGHADRSAVLHHSISLRLVEGPKTGQPPPRHGILGSSRDVATRGVER
ncbi:hypothetical protein OHT76_32740 [Streptomyces sp. NBC_00287]|uniref:hypothetical protein n=1 Tax=Streptomyces sp. NBC_00287 TaxID=2975702 RepID=UPI002E2AFD31|nr:hypothetical protein [Streptomyces sp. NBC_00287]